MGKAIVINGADFSQNAVAKEGWYLLNLTNPQTDISNYEGRYLTSDNWIITDFLSLRGKTINSLRVRADQDTSMKITVWETSSSANQLPALNSTITKVKEVNVEISAGSGVITFEPITISPTQIISIKPFDRHCVRFANTADNPDVAVTSEGLVGSAYQNHYFEIDFGYLD